MNVATIEGQAEDRTDQVIVDRVGSLGLITLNRPDALNSLTLPMVRTMRESLELFARDERVRAVLLKGAGTRGLCAGGDIRDLVTSIKAKDGYAASFMKEEYELDSYIARYRKPYVSIMSGIVMGGGVGVSAHGSHRIATDTTRLAMPEVGVGFLPDVGATYILARAPSNFGIYLALTGETIDGATAKFTGFVDYVLPQDKIEGLERELYNLPPGAAHATVGEMISRYARADTQPLILDRYTDCAEAFSRRTVEEIVSALATVGSAFAMKTRDVMLSRSPTSLKVTLDLLREANSASLDECLTAEFRAAVAMFDGHDFLEGVRAAVIDKDRKPKWSPPDLESVDERAVQLHRQPRSDEPQFTGRS